MFSIEKEKEKRKYHIKYGSGKFESSNPVRLHRINSNYCLYSVSRCASTTFLGHPKTDILSWPENIQTHVVRHSPPSSFLIELVANGKWHTLNSFFAHIPMYIVHPMIVVCHLFAITRIVSLKFILSNWIFTWKWSKYNFVANFGIGSVRIWTDVMCALQTK